MSLETKRIKELFGYARTLTKEQGVGVMAARAAGFFKRRFFGKKARYLPAKQTLDTQRADAGQNAKNWPVISILTPLYNTPPQFLQQFLDSVQRCGLHRRGAHRAGPRGIRPAHCLPQD